MTRSTLEKLNAMSDMEFEAIDLTPDYGEDEQEG